MTTLPRVVHKPSRRDDWGTTLPSEVAVGMPTLLDRPPSVGNPEPAPERPRPPESPRPGRSWFERYAWHLLIGGASVIGIAASPLLLGSASRSTLSTASAPTQPTQITSAPLPPLSTNVTFTASEFKFTPSSTQVPVGQKVSITLNNTGVVEHDVTIQDTPFSLTAKPGQQATADFTFDKPGTYTFICSIAGHKEAGMKGTLTAVDPAAGAPVAAVPAASTSMADMPGMNIATAADIKPLPANLQALPSPQMAPPLDRAEPAYVKLDLTTQKVTARMADGVAYEYWTFNGTVPGPMLRVREGDTVEIDLHNAPDAGVTHSIDLHSVSGPGGGAKVTQIAPGEDGRFKFQALNPGVYVYHCATPMVAQHIASGMYGMIVVEPKAGLPKVDHEYYLMEGDFYLQGQRGDTGLRAFDLNKMLDERPDYVLFNGAVGSLTGDNALHAKVGDTVRIFFGVGGPNLTSSFHVIGAVFDRVFTEGSLTSEPATNVQTTHVSAGGTTVVDFTVRVPGTYTLVDHSLGRLEKGAAGQIVVDGPADPEIFQPLTNTASAAAAE
jgi:nitrite reductase (NO-forming)